MNEPKYIFPSWQELDENIARARDPLPDDTSTAQGHFWDGTQWRYFVDGMEHDIVTLKPLTRRDYDPDPAIPCPFCAKPLTGHSTEQLRDCHYMMSHRMEERVYGATAAAAATAREDTP